jgi:RNA polymerase sigma-70 factor (ECF subfamily)
MNDARIVSFEGERSEIGPTIEERVRLAQNGDSHASESIFAELWPICLRVARRMTGSDPDAEDAVQEAYVKALTNLHRFDHRCAFRTWILRIVTNCATDQLRRRRRKQILVDFSSWLTGVQRDSAEPSQFEDPSAPMLNAELRVRLDEALGQLSETTRGAFVLYAEAGMTYQEVADTLEVPLGTVMSRIHSARKKLRSIVECLDDDSVPGGRPSAAPASEANSVEDAQRRLVPNSGIRSLSSPLTW